MLITIRDLQAYESGDFATALREWKPLAEQGHARAQSILGFLYANGQGVPQDYTTALEWYTLAAEQGFATAQFNLGVMYHNGEGVSQDLIYAHMWGSIAASNGHMEKGYLRDEVAKEMTPTQIAKAQELASECVRKEYKGC